MNQFKKIFKDKKAIIGMVHLKALPGSPLYKGCLEEVYQDALHDLKILEEGKVDAVIVENFGDVPYDKTNELINYTSFTKILTELKKNTALPVGINIQFNDYNAEWAIGYACDVDFIRVEVLAENRMGPNGVLEACGSKLLRLKAKYPKDIAIFADVAVKHTFPIVEQPLDFTIESIIEEKADAIICTGITTGKSPSVEEVETIKKYAKDFPVILGSGVNDETVKDYLKVADGAIIGSYFKENGDVHAPVDKARVERIMKQIKSL